LQAKEGTMEDAKNPQSQKDASDARMTSRYRTAKGASRNCRAWRLAVPVWLSLGSASHLVDAPVLWGRSEIHAL
jgi:hypothetical protein